MAVQHLDAETSKRVDPSSSSSWGPEAAEAMCNEVRHLQIPSGKHNNLTLGDLIDRTPKHTISKVMLEEKIFSIWHAGRTVLLGDGKYSDVLQSVCGHKIKLALTSNLFLHLCSKC